ncbi:MAG: tetratricopeptide repeat protein [Gammaproteobacteria bacterium]|nr:tetratricopeptide repeat protein [Gammaproteobacteria bacterium]
MSAEDEHRGSFEAALKRTAHLIDVDPVLAADQATEILKALPNHPPALFFLAMAKRRSGDPQAALDVLEPLLNAQHEWAAAWFERGMALGALGRGDEAINALLKAVKFQSEHPEAWRVLADHFTATGDADRADAAYARHIKCSTRDPMLQEAAAAMVKNDVATAERALKKHLFEKPTDVAAIRMLAEVAIRCGQDSQAEKLLVRCLELAPSFAAARYNYALLLQRREDSPRALIEIEKCLEADPDRPGYRNLAAVILGRVGEFARASEMYARLLAEYPDQARVWLSYGHVLKTEGRQQEAIDAYRACIERDPQLGEAYWSIANLKTFQFEQSDLSAMKQQMEDSSLSDKERWHLHFALGKAYEDTADYEESFRHYADGNALYLANHTYDADYITTRTERLMSGFSRDYFEKRKGLGSTAPDPIFIIGMPRAGSTLLEQILSCHSAIEGTSELPDMITLAQQLRAEADTQEVAAYASVLAQKSAEELSELGDLYIERTRIHRKTDRPFFIDKMPNNFLYLGIIQSILPNAKIIDARRHPMGCCFSNFKQFYAKGQNFSYSLEDTSRFYRDYVRLMAHFDEVLPGRVHRVFYEDTVADTERVVREMLEYCELEYEPECLRFFESQRPVRTASSEQVRQPINRKGVEQWQNYEPWLEPLKETLGDVLDEYPTVPQF